MIQIKRDVSTGPDQEALQREWIETNGRGGYASSTVLNCHTRKYHGLLVANLDAPAGRYILLSKFEDSLLLPERELFLACHLYPGCFFPETDWTLEEYRGDLSPSFVYLAEGLSLRKTLLLLPGEDCLLVRYDIEDCPATAVLRLKPFVAFRGFHDLSKHNPWINDRIETVNNGIVLEPYEGMPALFIQTNLKSRFLASPLWYDAFEYPREAERGYDCHEDLFLPGTLEVPVKKGTSVVVTAAMKPQAKQPKRLWIQEMARRGVEAKDRAAFAANFDTPDRECIETLIRAGRQFMIRTPAGRPAVVAGYHWFGDWGRDTLISLPGLTFCQNRHQEGIDILLEISRHESEGLLPNCFAEGGMEPAYNSVDSSLWFFWTVQQMLRYTGEYGIVEDRLWPVMKRILRKFMNGTAYDIRAGAEGLLHAGNPGSNLTWMDACLDGKPATPRWGYPVEINALWYNAVCFSDELSRSFGDGEFSFAELIPLIRRSFRETFWIEREGHLGDVFCNGLLDRAIRPNQIFAVSLPFPESEALLTPEQQTSVVNVVEEHLLTPCGLRSLSPADRNYQGRYGGNTASRDGAYHQGTVWPWLLGHFGEAYLRTHQDTASAKDFLLKHLRSFLGSHLPEACMGSVSEIFDGDPPHHPGGCISQAWSVAELIRLYVLLREAGTVRG
ncbi:MAG: glycogen debranching enzyme family protein [Deltaproteobacteria bacterium]|nr:glycogen debranching enzyme family protein [Deltaproteobacteria bacterium]